MRGDEEDSFGGEEDSFEVSKISSVQHDEKEELSRMDHMSPSNANQDGPFQTGEVPKVDSEATKKRSEILVLEKFKFASKEKSDRVLGGPNLPLD